jgi:SagB-type dehydrogenase family enzyme
MLSLLLLSFGLSVAEDLKPIQLPEPRMEGGRPLMEVLKDRQSSREFSPEELSMQELSNLLWAAFGINRSDIGKRTAPSARNKQEMDIYVATADGLYLYEAKEHVLRPVLAEDVREATGPQPFVKDAPVNLVYVADFAKMVGYTEDQKEFYSAANTGHISQNVYLYCASEGLATVVRGLVDRPALAKKMGLRPDQKVLLAQTVGYPKK